jgi:predicted Zn-dependent protease
MSAVVFVLFMSAALAQAVNVAEYLQKYGYLATQDNELQVEKNALIDLQRVYGFPDDGELNEDTLKFMESPRCGNPDNIHDFTVSEKWKKNVLTWDVRTHHHSKAYIVLEVYKAFALWAKYTNLTFHRSHSIVQKPDIVISVVNNDVNNTHRNYFGNSKCSSTMGEGVLGHAFFPSTSQTTTEVHINGNVSFGNQKGQYPLFPILAHELGHSLGIGHTSVRKAIMYPVYQEGIIDLDEDDILAIQQLYGKPASRLTTPTTTTTTTNLTPKVAVTRHPATPPPTSTSTTAATPTVSTTTQQASPPEIPVTIIKPPIKNTPSENTPKSIESVEVNTLLDICTLDIGRLKFLVLHNNLYIFYTNKVWIMRLDNRKFTVESANIHDHLTFLPPFKDITAVYQRPNGQLVLIIDQIYLIEYPGFRLIEKYPLSYFHTPRFPNITAMLNTNQGRTYIFMKELYTASVDECNFRRGSYEYATNNFPGLPAQIDNAFRYTDGRLYFFYKDRFFQYNEFTQSLEKSDKTSLNIFGIPCPNVSLFDQLKNLLTRILNNNSLQDY